jgi:hypothetical protein
VNPAAGFPPKLTAVAPAKPVPVIATAVPPASGPDVGLSDDTTGAAAGAGVNVTVASAVAVAVSPFWSTPPTVTVSVCDAPATPMKSPVNEHDGLDAPGANVTPVNAPHVLPALVARSP